MRTEVPMDVFEIYNNTMKSWSEFFRNSNSNRMWDWPGSTFRAPGTEEWYRPWSTYMENWQKMARGFADVTAGKGPMQSMKDSTEAVTKGIDAYLKLCDSWIKSNQRIAAEGMGLVRKLGAGEKPDTAPFFEAMEAAYAELSGSIADSLKRTPLSGAKDVDEAMKRFLDAFPEEQKMARDFYQQLFDSALEATKASNSAVAEAGGALSQMVEKGTLSVESCSDLIGAYGNTLKQSIEVVRPWAALFPSYNQFVEDVISWAKMSVDVGTCWLEMNVKLQKAVRDSFLQVYSSAQETLSESQALASPDEWARKWSEAYERGTKKFVESSDAFKSVPAFIDQYTECLSAAAKLYRSVTRIPFATKAEIEKVSKDIEKAKAQAEKSSRKPAAPVAP